ncbi:hypothetical protein JCM11491_001659 [Sporobolomyces phaffii]
MIPNRSQPAPLVTQETVQHRLARLRQEQTPRPRYNAAASSARTASNTPAAAWLRPITASTRTSAPTGSTRGATGRSGAAGPPPPPSWNSPTLTHADSVDLTSRAPVKTPRIRPRQLAERSRLAVPLDAAQGGRARDSAAPRVDSLFTIAGHTLARDLAQGPGHSILLEHVAYLPTELKLRILDLIADSRNEFNLTGSGAKMLLRTDLDDREDAADRNGEWNHDDWEADDARLSLESIHLRDEFSTPLATALTALDLSFSSISLKTLRSVLLHPSASSSASVVAVGATPKLVPVFPHLHSLVLCSVRNVPLVHDQFFHLLSALLSLRTLSLVGNSVSLAPAASDESTAVHCCAPNAFLFKLANATPLVRSLDLSFVGEQDRSPDDGRPYDATRAVHGIDWSKKWLDLKVLGLRSTTPVDLEHEEEGHDVSVRTARQKQTRDLIMGQRTRAKWIDVVI